MKLSSKEIGHWSFYGSFHKEFDTEVYFGFLYIIENKSTKQYYIGKKQFRNKGAKKSKNYNKELSWRTYTGSSSSLNSDIKRLGKENFSFEIIDLYKTKGGLYYSEAYCQMVLGSMTEYKEDKKTPVFYNQQIAAIRFVPKEAITLNTEKFIRNFKRRV